MKTLRKITNLLLLFSFSANLNFLELTTLIKTRALGIQCKLCFVEQRRKENRASLIKKFNLQELILKCVVILLGMLLMANLTWHKNEFKFLDVKKETMKYEQ